MTTRMLTGEFAGDTRAATRERWNHGGLSKPRRRKRYEILFVFHKKNDSARDLSLFLVSDSLGQCSGKFTKAPRRLRGNHRGILHPLDCEGGGNLSAPRLGRGARLYRQRIEGGSDARRWKYRRGCDRRPRGCGR